MRLKGPSNDITKVESLKSAKVTNAGILANPYTCSCQIFPEKFFFTLRCKNCRFYVTRVCMNFMNINAEQDTVHKESNCTVSYFNRV